MCRTPGIGHVTGRPSRKAAPITGASQSIGATRAEPFAREMDMHRLGLGEPEDGAGAALFPAAHEAGDMTGASMPVDGGSAAK